MATLIADCETDGLLPSMTKLHMVQIGDADTDELQIYADSGWAGVHPDYLQRPIKPLLEGIERLRRADRYVFHNGLSFDQHAINRFYPGTIVAERMVDTLVAARLSDPEERNHTLRAWGQRLGVLKGDYKGDYQVVDDDFLAYSEQDIVVGRGLYHKVKHVLDWGTSYQLEHDTTRAILLQEANGFPLDVAGAEALAAEFRGQLDDMLQRLQDVFPPLTRTLTKVAGASNKNKGRIKGQPYVTTWQDPFNPASRRQIAERLILKGWKPKATGADGNPTVDEAVLASLAGRFPEAKLLSEYFRTLKMLGQLSDGKAGWLRLVKNGRVHGRVNPNGACTGRMSHSRPNMAQVDKDKRMRSLWRPRAGWKLVGCDAEGLEARMLGHYLARYDGGAFSDRVVNGKKEDGTDVHSANLKAVKPLGLCSRDGAKTLLYALMYGAGDAKLGYTVKLDCRAHGAPIPKMPNMELGAAVRGALARSMKGMDKLTAEIKARAKSRGYLIGLDGRRLFIRSQHSALNTLLQGGGAIVMKKALCLFMDEMGLNALDQGGDFGLCANVHDEVQIEARPDLADGIGKRFAANITLAGVILNVKCPLAGAYDVGESWAETH